MNLTPDIWVYALVRRVELSGSFATIARKGDARGGAILVKTINRRTGATQIWSRATRGDGESIWMRPVVSETEADIDAYVERAIKIDPDLWIVEIEDHDGRRFLTEPTT